MKVVSLLSHSFCATRPASKEISSELFTDILAHRKLGEIFQSYPIHTFPVQCCRGKEYDALACNNK